MTGSLADALRFVVIALWLINLLAVSFTVLFYVFRGDTRTQIRYVALIGASFVCYSSVAVLDTFARIGGPVTWRLFFNLAAGGFGTVALLYRMFHERDRVNE